MKDIIIAGIQWSWKGTQCKKLLDTYWTNIRYFEAGWILRALQSSDNAVWNYIWSVIDKWNLLKDEFMIKVFDLFLATIEGKENMLVDWFPRQKRQMELFLERMTSAKRNMVVVVLEISKDEAIKRLWNRRMCKKCGEILNVEIHGNIAVCPSCWGNDLYQRIDDKDQQAIEKRIWLYEELTVPVIAYLEQLWLVKRINGEQSIEKVFQDIEQVIS